MDKRKEIIDKVSKIPCTFLDENKKSLEVDMVIKEFSLLLTTEIEKEDFSLSSIDKLVDLHFILDFLDSLLKKYKKCYINLGDSITWVKVITCHTEGPHEGQMKIALQMFEESHRWDQHEDADT